MPIYKRPDRRSHSAGVGESFSRCGYHLSCCCQRQKFGPVLSVGDYPDEADINKYEVTRFLDLSPVYRVSTV